MYSQGVNFDIENTTWWKQDGSDHFKVRSVFFDGTGMSIQTYDGRMISGDVLRDYIQSEEPISKPKTPTAPKINRAALMQGLSSDELGDVFINTPSVGSNLDSKQNQKPIETGKPASSESKPISPESANDIIIKRMMDNLGYPKIDFNIKIDITQDYMDKLKTSAQVMGVDIKDIKNYMCNNLNGEDIRESLVEQFSKAFDDNFQDTPPEPDELEKISTEL